MTTLEAEVSVDQVGVQPTRRQIELVEVTLNCRTPRGSNVYRWEGQVKLWKEHVESILFGWDGSRR